LKIIDVFKLEASLFMHDFKRDLLPKSFRNSVKIIVIKIKE